MHHDSRPSSPKPNRLPESRGEQNRLTHEAGPGNRRSRVTARARPLFALALAGALAPWVSCMRQPPAPPPRIPIVTVAHPARATVTNWDEYPGHLEAVETVEIRSRVAGYLASIHFTDGAEVRSGDLLFVIDPRPYEAELRRAQAERRRAETQAELARNDLERARTLRAHRAISEEEFDARTKGARAAEDALAAARAAEAAAELNLTYTRIEAPIDGKIGRRFVTVGNMIQGSTQMPGTLLATLVSLDPIYAYFDVPEAAFQRYRRLLPGLENPGASAVACELGLAGEDGFPHRGRIDFVDNRVNPATGTLRLRAVLANPDRVLVPGMFARIRIPVERIEGALLVPEAAILSEQTRKFVYVVNEQRVVEARPVHLGRAHGAQRVVLAGIGPGDAVVVSGLLMLRPGMQVQVARPEAAAPGPSAASTAAGPQ
jgi:RND family efflux transporter MFP subunit